MRTNPVFRSALLMAALLPGFNALAQDALAQHALAQHEHHGDTAMKADSVDNDYSLYHLDADWTSHRGESVQLSGYAGKPVIITMIYGSCNTACPILVHDARRIEQALPPNLAGEIEVVIVSFDGKRDQPEALADYARRQKANQPHWHFLHGEDADIRTLAALLGIRYRDNGDGSFDHSNVVAVLDAQGRIVHRNEGLLQPVDPAMAAIGDAVASRDKDLGMTTRERPL